MNYGKVKITTLVIKSYSILIQTASSTSREKRATDPGGTNGVYFNDMKCIVNKVNGEYCYGETGILLSAKENSAGNSIASVLTDTGIKNWYLPQIEVIK